MCYGIRRPAENTGTMDEQDFRAEIGATQLSCKAEKHWKPVKNPRKSTKPAPIKIANQKKDTQDTTELTLGVLLMGN